MRLLEILKRIQFFWTGTALPAKLGLGILLLGLAGPALVGLAGPALGGREAPAVWVPLDANQPMGLVPWTPDYLAAPGPGLLDGAVQSGVLPSNTARANTGPQNRQKAIPGAAGAFTLSDMLRDIDWRRQTAKRLRQHPDFKPRF